MSCTIELENWMGHTALTLDITAPVAFVVGENWVGKTAIRDALEFAYLGTGELRGIKTKKLLGKLSITDGATECAVTIKTPLVWLRRDMKRDGTQTVERTSRPDTESEMPGWERVPLDKPITGGVAHDAMRLVFEPTSFYRLDARSRRELLVSCTTEAGQTYEGILEELRKALQPEDPEDEKALQQAAKKASTDGFREAEEMAGECRRVAKRALAEVDVTPPDFSHISPEILKSFGSHSIEEFEAKLGKLREDHTAAVAREAVSTTAIEGRLTEAQSQKTAAENAEYENRDAGAADALEAATKALVEGREALGQANDDVTKAQEIVTGLGGPSTAGGDFERPKTCPAVPFEMKCPVQMKTFKARQAEIIPEGDRETKLEGARELVEVAVTVAEQADATVESLLVVKAESTDRVDRETQRQAREDAMATAIDLARARCEEIEGELLEAKQAAESGDGAPKAEQLQENIRLGEQMVRARIDWEHALEVDRAAKAQHDRLEASIERWDAIAQILKPEGIESKLGGGAREAFLAAMKCVEGLAGLVKLDSEYEITVERDGKEWHPLQLSTSQRLALGVAIQHAVASMIHFPILLIDAVDLFDGPSRREFGAFAAEVAPSYGGAVIALATLGINSPANPPPGFETFWLRKGEPVERLSHE